MANDVMFEGKERRIAKNRTVSCRVWPCQSRRGARPLSRERVRPI